MDTPGAALRQRTPCSAIRISSRSEFPRRGTTTRNYEDDWGERYQGLLTRGPDGSDNYAPEANQLLAKNLKGKLLLAHGTMDDNVPFYNTLLVVNELMRANKDFDLLLLPNRAHGFGNEPYMVRRRWDYFVKNLLGAEPPKEYQIGTRR